MKNQKALVITIALFLALISLSCSALRPTYPGFGGGYGLARVSTPQAKTLKAKNLTPQQQIKQYRLQIRILKAKIRQSQDEAEIKRHKKTIRELELKIKGLQHPPKQTRN